MTLRIGLIDADVDGGVLKQRIAREGADDLNVTKPDCVGNA
jgi:hypothetical protein